MELGSSPTNYPGRTLIQMRRAFVVFRDYPGSWSRLLRKAVRVRAFCAWSLTRFARLGFGKIEKTKRKKLVALVEGMVSVE